MAKIVYRQMPAPRELSQQIPAPRAKAKMQKPQDGGKFLVQIFGGARGGGGAGVVMDEIDICIINMCFLSEERLFSLIGDLNKTILVAFITRLVRHQEKTKLNSEITMYCFSEYSNFFGTPYILLA